MVTVRAKAGILIVGTEVLTGSITDRNAPWLSERLRELGVEVAMIQIVGDRSEDLLAALEYMAGVGMSLVVTSGGLGASADELAAEVVARFSGREMVPDPQLEARIAEILSPMITRWPGLDPEAIRASNRKAMIPRGATVLEPVGTALGLVVPPLGGSGPTVVVLPGPPQELQTMWEMARDTDAFRDAIAQETTPRRGMMHLAPTNPDPEIADTVRVPVPVPEPEIASAIRAPAPVPEPEIADTVPAPAPEPEIASAIPAPAPEPEIAITIRQPEPDFANTIRAPAGRSPNPVDKTRFLRWAVIGLALAAVTVAIYVLATSGSTSHSQTAAQTSPPKAAPAQPAQPIHRSQAPAAVSPKLRTVTLQLVPTGQLYVCLVDGKGNRLIPGLIFAAGQRIPVKSAPELLLTLGNASVQMKVNGSAFTVSRSADPIGYLLKPGGSSPLPLSKQPQCAA